MLSELDWMRSGMTVMAFVTFVAIVAWAWSARKKNDFDQAARSVLDDEDLRIRGGGHE